MGEESSEKVIFVAKRIPVSIDTISSSSASDDLATSEASVFGSGLSAEKIKELALASEHKRNETFKNHFEKIAIIVLWSAFIFLALLFVIWAFHLMAPLKFRWLSDSQMDSIKGLLSGGVIASVATGYFKKRLQ